MWARQFAEALSVSNRERLDRFVTMQNHYNLTYREEEREMLPLCANNDVGVIPWSPLARGFLTRPHEAFLETIRAEYMEDDNYFSQRIATYRAGGGETVNERVEQLVSEKGVKMAQIAIAWLLHQDAVDAPIIGTTSIEHLEDAVEAISIDLSSDECSFLEEPYEPVAVNGHQ